MTALGPGGEHLFADISGDGACGIALGTVVLTPDQSLPPTGGGGVGPPQTIDPEGPLLDIIRYTQQNGLIFGRNQRQSITDRIVHRGAGGGFRTFSKATWVDGAVQSLSDVRGGIDLDGTFADVIVGADRVLDSGLLVGLAVAARDAPSMPMGALQASRRAASTPAPMSVSRPPATGSSTHGPYMASQTRTTRLVRWLATTPPSTGSSRGTRSASIRSTPT